MPQNRMSSRVRSMPPSGIREFFDIAATMEDVISLSIGEPDFKTPHHVRQAGHASIESSTAYTSNQGLLELREAIAAHLERLYGVRYNPHTEILITVGVSEGLQSLALGVLNAGDEVIMSDPYYVAYPGCVMTADAKPVFVRTNAADAFQISARAIEEAITPRTRALMLGYPSNPTGAIMSRERLLEIAELAERYDLMVFSDEIYDRMVYGAEHVCFASLPGMRERTALFGGFSKSYAMTGWRIAWLAAPEDMTLSASKIHQYSILSAPTMGQHAALQAMLYGEEDVQAMVAEYDRRRRFIVDGFNSLGLPTFEPQGAFYAFPYVGRFGLSSKEFAKKLLMEAQVAIIPGSAFGEGGEGHARVCYATSMENLEIALERIKAFLQRQGWLDSIEVASGALHHDRRVEQLVVQPETRIG